MVCSDSGVQTFQLVRLSNNAKTVTDSVQNHLIHTRVPFRNIVDKTSMFDLLQHTNSMLFGACQPPGIWLLRVMIQKLVTTIMVLMLMHQSKTFVGFQYQLCSHFYCSSEIQFIKVK